MEDTPLLSQCPADRGTGENLARAAEKRAPEVASSSECPIVNTRTTLCRTVGEATAILPCAVLWSFLNMIAYRNSILQRLTSEVIQRLELRAVELPLNHEVEFPGNEIPQLLFLEDGVASMTATFLDGSQVEIGLAGREAVLGTSSMMGTRRSLNRVYMQIAGRGYATRMSTATREFRRGEQFHDLALRYVQAQFVQSAQTAGCNARHEIEQRLARWLLLCADRVNADVLPLRHEFLAYMLGVTRTSVTIAAGEFQEDGLIQYSRGKVQIRDRKRLEMVSCECYTVVRDHLSSYLDTEQGSGERPETQSLHSYTPSARISIPA